MRSGKVPALTSEAFQPELPPEAPTRPAGVTLVAALFAIVSVAALAFAVLLALDAMPLSYGSLLLPNGLEQSGPVAFLVYAALTGILAAGLWKQRGWARRFAVLIAVIGIVLVVPGISSAVVDGRPAAMARDGTQIIVRVAIVFYLSQEPVKEWFAARHDQLTT
jgi:hypothetical protein